MSRRFQVLLDRYALVRREIDTLLAQPRPNLMRLVRLRRLQLVISERLQAFVKASAIRRASAPRLSPYPPTYAYARAIPSSRVF